MTTPKLIRIPDAGRGIAVICEGHVDPLAFARRVDVDDVATFLGDDYDADDQGCPTEATDDRIADRVRHVRGRWLSDAGGRRRWVEVAGDDPDGSPFTVLGS